MDAPPERPANAWQRAIDFGIDVSLLEENLRLTPDERLQQLMAMQRLFDMVQAERSEARAGDR